MPGWTAILFDMDDTLFPEREFVHSGFQAVSVELERSHAIAARSILRELTEIFELGPRDRIFDTYLARHKIDDPHLLNHLIDIYRHHVPRIELRPGMRSLLEDLHSQTRVGLVSDGLLSMQRNKFAALNIDSLFDAVVFSDVWGREFWKPHPRPFVTVLTELQVNPPDAVYVADNPRKDFDACASLGMPSIRLRIPDGFYGNEETSDGAGQPTWTVSGVEELRLLLLT